MADSKRKRSRPGIKLEDPIQQFTNQMQQQSIAIYGFPLALQLLAYRNISGLLDKIPGSADERTFLEWHSIGIPKSNLIINDVHHLERVPDMTVILKLFVNTNEDGWGEWDDEVRDKKEPVVEHKKHIVIRKRKLSPTSSSKGTPSKTKVSTSTRGRKRNFEMVDDDEAEDNDDEAKDIKLWVKSQLSSIRHEFAESVKKLRSQNLNLLKKIRVLQSVKSYRSRPCTRHPSKKVRLQTHLSTVSQSPVNPVVERQTSQLPLNHHKLHWKGESMFYLIQCMMETKQYQKILKRLLMISYGVSLKMIRIRYPWRPARIQFVPHKSIWMKLHQLYYPSLYMLIAPSSLPLINQSMTLSQNLEKREHMTRGDIVISHRFLLQLAQPSNRIDTMHMEVLGNFLNERHILTLSKERAHWVGLEIKLGNWCVDILDPNYRLNDDRQVDDWTRMKGIYVNERSGDCGPVSMKLIEIYATGGNAEKMALITDEIVNEFMVRRIGISGFRNLGPFIAAGPEWVAIVFSDEVLKELGLDEFITVSSLCIEGSPYRSFLLRCL
ncbi:unnamed protein product [Arabidopsis thaliana]|uniref:(thale cress) hypothetical protein n=1 Tax=Arabidopsis thaliana TaxID=3702 RepID=A0A7G2EXQ1_ARATH|nr:unnamed protein product [Arabidopsis thaliana]